MLPDSNVRPFPLPEAYVPLQLGPRPDAPYGIDVSGPNKNGVYGFTCPHTTTVADVERKCEWRCGAYAIYFRQYADHHIGCPHCGLAITIPRIQEPPDDGPSEPPVPS